MGAYFGGTKIAKPFFGGYKCNAYMGGERVWPLEQQGPVATFWDTFDNTAGTSAVWVMRDQHVSDSGGVWSKYSSGWSFGLASVDYVLPAGGRGLWGGSTQETSYRGFMYPSVQPGSADCYVEVEYPAITVSSIYAGLLPFVLRADSFEVSNGATNWQGFRVHVGRNRSTQSVLQLVRLTHTTTADAGAATTLFSEAITNAEHTVRLEAVGSQIRLYLDGIQKYSLSDAQNQNVIGCGLRASGSTDATSNFLTRYEHGNM